MLMKFQWLLLLISLLVFSKAYAIYPKTDSDFRKLPTYCVAKLRSDSSRKETSSDYWLKRLGPNYRHVHHFCAALHMNNVIKGSYPTNKSEREYILNLNKGILNEVKYMEEHATKDFKIWPTMYIMKAIAYGRLDDHRNAISYFQKAIDSNKKYFMSYLEFAKYYKSKGDINSAIKIIDKGVAVIPKQKYLIKYKQKLLSIVKEE